MTDCVAMQDRMPSVALGVDAWTVDEAAHLVGCAECAMEWRIVRAGTALHATNIVDAERIAAWVADRLRTEPPQVRPIRRLPWRGGLIGLLAAAASVALVVSAPHGGPDGAGGLSDSALLAIAPELQGMDDQQLESVLKGLEPAPEDVVAPNDGQHLEDLTDAQLKELLRAMGGK